MKRTIGTLVLLAGLGGCQSMEMDHGTEVACPYCGPNKSSLPTLGVPAAKNHGETYAPTAQTAEVTTTTRTPSRVGQSSYKVCGKNGCKVYSREHATMMVVSPTESAPSGGSNGVIQASYTTSAKADPVMTRVVDTKPAKLPPNLGEHVTRKKGRPSTTSVVVPPPLPVEITEQAVSKPVTSKAAPSTTSVFNNKRIVINYEVKGVGPTGVSAVDLWYTRDKQNWEKVDLASQSHSPYVVEVAEEGRYGFTLLARNGVGVGKQPPHSGEEPQVWTEVDMTRPVVQLVKIEGGVGDKAHNLTVQWKASDRNFGEEPITLSYAEKSSGPWLPLAANLENTGKYVLKVPSGMPSRFLVRVEAVDEGGNVGSDQTPKPLVVDLAQPTVSILSMEAGKKAER